VLGDSGRFVVRGRLTDPAEVFFGMTMNHPKGGFAGKYYARRQFDGGGPFEWVIPLGEFVPQEPVFPPSPAGVGTRRVLGPDAPRRPRPRGPLHRTAIRHPLTPPCHPGGRPSWPARSPADWSTCWPVCCSWVWLPRSPASARMTRPARARRTPRSRRPPPTGRCTTTTPPAGVSTPPRRP
jgi:hypothetical protein